MIGQTFRVWDNRYKQYVKPYAVCLDGRAIVITEPCNDLETLDSERAIIEFGTGIKDKNGKEIYEGDILSAFGNYYEVVFENERAGFVAKRVKGPEDDFFAGYFGRYLVNHCEVISNIHENLELLGKEKVKEQQ